MRCRKPMKAWKGQHVNPETGRRPVAFKMMDGFHDLPLEFGCGQCIPCRLAWSRNWAARADAEARMSVRPCYTVTLTYDDEHLPWGSGSRSTVCVRDVQTFYKRLRFAVGPFRHMTAGEYGEKSGRAHYHGSLFGVALDDLRFWKNSPAGGPMFVSRTVDRLWGQGLVSIQPFSASGAEYVAKYVLKAIKGPAAEAEYADREPPFSSCRAARVSVRRRTRSSKRNGAPPVKWLSVVARRLRKLCRCPRSTWRASVRSFPSGTRCCAPVVRRLRCCARRGGAPLGGESHVAYGGEPRHGA